MTLRHCFPGELAKSVELKAEDYVEFCRGEQAVIRLTVSSERLKRGEASDVFLESNAEIDAWISRMRGQE